MIWTNPEPVADVSLDLHIQVPQKFAARFETQYVLLRDLIFERTSAVKDDVLIHVRTKAMEGGTSDKFAIIEAGGFYEVDGGEASVIPDEAFVGINTDPNDIPSKIDWGFVTTPQPALGGRKLDYTRGKTLGGSSARKYLVTSNSFEYTLSARKEVILSAGGFQSPQLLMVSGIGPSDTLKQYNISLIANLSGFGQNMWDSLILGPSYRVNVVTDLLISQNSEYAAPIAAQYINNQSGPLTYAAGYAACEKLPYRSTFRASTNASLAFFPSDWPELGYLPVDTYTGYPSQPSTSMLNDSFNCETIFTAHVAPLSRGNVTIKSTDTSDLPIINSNWLSRPADAEFAVAGFKRAR
ncbi:hypothetical protein HO133_000778 [Letharia lupina]|uniref:Glucose-methanol-choline oxidoreductase N-terminal domain-containing protein n=1 Tax=Letharia lupina TaxID=560253 RepID=A0A8H6CG35_9LECA|nr:uncharacterized protein HO133_000778 [Letharia lupina]KAF6222730.1 hypothetical protein HO133_000778 [Letharia lupina]